MGLDGVELIMEVEEKFEIRFEPFFEDMKTVGDMHRTVFEKLQLHAELLAETSDDPTLAPFVATRDALSKLTTIESHEITPHSQLAELLPTKIRKVAWGELQTLAGINLPALALPNFLWLTMLIVSLIVAVTVTSVSASSFGMYSVLTGMTAGIISGVVLRILFRPLEVGLPGGMNTVADVVRQAGPPRFAPQRMRPPIDDSDRVWSEIVRIVSHVLDVPTDEIHRDSRFREDLKVG